VPSFVASLGDAVYMIGLRICSAKLPSRLCLSVSSIDWGFLSTSFDFSGSVVDFEISSFDSSGSEVTFETSSFDSSRSTDATFY